LSKREYLYRSYFKSKNTNLNIPKSLTASPNNSLIKDIKSVYSFIDPATYSSEITRELLYQNPKYIHFIFIKDFLRVINDLNYQIPINFNSISNYLVHMIGPKTNNLTIGKNQDLYKSQYRPMRKGVMNMIRLQATNAVAMPIEIRLHILASSKDVIHS
jgi:protein involved in sex pheromone biosynthesis